MTLHKFVYTEYGRNYDVTVDGINITIAVNGIDVFKGNMNNFDITKIKWITGDVFETEYVDEKIHEILLEHMND